MCDGHSDSSDLKKEFAGVDFSEIPPADEWFRTRKEDAVRSNALASATKHVCSAVQCTRVWCLTGMVDDV